MNKNVFIAIVAAFLVALVVPGAQAAYIDFEDSAWSAAAGNQSFSSTSLTGGTIPGAPGVSLVLDALVDPASLGDPVLTWQNPDGIGIDLLGDNDEIDTELNEGVETLSVTFGQTTTLTSFTVSDLFDENSALEVGWYRTRTGTVWSDWVLFTATAGNTQAASNGYSTVAVGLDVDQINFKADSGITNGYTDNDFSLAGLTTSAGGETPEPGTMLLFGSAAGLIGFVRRRKANKAKRQ